jgi:hypothetical protein
MTPRIPRWLARRGAGARRNIQISKTKVQGNFDIQPSSGRILIPPPNTSGARLRPASRNSRSRSDGKRMV